MMTYVRRSGIKLYLPERAGLKDPITGETLWRFQDYATSATFIPTSNPNWQETDIKRDVVELQAPLKAYIDTMNSLILRVLQTTGLSPASVGFDNDGANASGVAISIRERTSIRTREEKLRLWSEGLSKLSSILLLLASAAYKGEKITIDNLNKLEVIVEFPPYVTDIDVENAKVDLILKKMKGGLMTQEEALREIYPTLPERELQEKLEKIRADKALTKSEEDK